MDQELWMKALHFHGPLLLQTVLNEAPEFEQKIEKDKLSMCKFIKDNLHLLLTPCESAPNHAKDIDIPIVPMEIFQDVSPVDRRDLFFKSLDRGNILTLKVINDSLPDDYKLLVLCKHDCCMKLDDLSLTMYLPKLQEELNLAGGKLESNDLIRAAVCSCDIDKRKLNVTLDSNILDDENVKLGKITESELPPYIGDVDFGASYVEYLHQSPYFKNPQWSDQLHSVLNFKKNHLYSFFKDLDGKQYSIDEYAPALKLKQNCVLSKAQCDKATQLYENGNFTEAFIYLNAALNLWSDNTEALVLRGTLYANINNLRKAFVDIEEALRLDPSHEGGCKQMSILLVAAARLHMESNNLNEAQESLDAALHVDNNNPDAIVAVEEIRQRRAGIVSSTNHDKYKSKIKIGSCTSESSRKDELDRHATFLEISTRAFLNSTKQKGDKDKSKNLDKDKTKSPLKSRSKSPLKSRSKSPQNLITID